MAVELSDGERTRRGTRPAFLSLRDYFKQTGRNQYEVAKAAGISESHLSNILRGFRTPSYRLALTLSRLTDVPVERVAS